jgi:hypothetical protein
VLLFVLLLLVALNCALLLLYTMPFAVVRCSMAAMICCVIVCCVCVCAALASLVPALCGIPTLLSAYCYAVPLL